MKQALELLPRVRLLGSTQVCHGQICVPVRGEKQRILLAHLALSEGDPVPLGLLVSDMWPENEPRNVRHALQEHVSRLRSSIGVPIELVEGVGYRLAQGSMTSDIQSFTELCGEGKNRLDAGDFDGAIYKFQQAFELWSSPNLLSLPERDGLRSQVLHLEEMWRNAASLRIEAHLEAGQADSIISELRSSLRTDPLRDHAWYQLILALHQANRRSEAVAAYQQARDIFIRELGVKPAEYVTELHARLVSNVVQAPPPLEGRVVRSLLPLQSDSPLVGRREEMDLLGRMWQESERDTRVVAISGEAGVGKTTLVLEFATHLVPEGTLIASDRRPFSPTAPYRAFEGPLTSSLGQARRLTLPANVRKHAEALERYMSGKFAKTEHDSDSAAFEDSVASWLEALSTHVPFVLFLDGFERADNQSISLLLHLIHSPRKIRGLIIAALRDDDLTSNSVAADLFRQSRRARHIPLAPLTEEHSITLVRREAEAMGIREVPRGFSADVFAAARGNPLFLVELTRHLLPTGNGDATSQVAVPAGLKDVITSVIGDLSQPSLELLKSASVLGMRFSPADLVQIAAATGQAVDSMIVEALQARALSPSEQGDPTYNFSNNIIRSVLYDYLTPTERSNLHGKAAEVLEGRPNPDHEQVADHHLRTGQPASKSCAAKHLLAAGHNALGRNEPAEAKANFSKAFSLLQDAHSSTLRCDILIGLGVAMHLCGERAYREVLLEACQLAIDLKDADRLIHAVLNNTRGWWSSSLGIDHERVMKIEAALGACDPNDKATLSQLLALWSQENVRDEACRDVVLARSEKAVALATESEEPDALLRALLIRFATLYALFEEPSECVNLARRMMRLAQRRGDRMMTLSGSLCLAQASMRFADYRVADRYMDQAEHLAKTMNHPSRLWLVRGWKAMRELGKGNFEHAEEQMKQAYELGVRTGQEDADTWFAGQQYTLHLLRGTLPQFLEEAGVQAKSLALPIPGWRAAFALALAKSGHLKEAETILEEFSDSDFQQLPRDLIWLNSMSYLAMTCEILARVDIAERIYTHLQPFSGMVATVATIDAGPVDLRLGALSALMGKPDTARALLQNTVDVCRRISAAVWMAQAEELLARLN